MKITSNNLIYILVGVDVLLFYIGVIIPSFKDIGLFEYISSIPDMAGRDQFLAWNWVVMTGVSIISWIGLCAYWKWARYIYLFPLLCGSISVFLAGAGGNGPGIFDVALNLGSVYYGFFICMLFFSSLADKFTDVKK